MLYAPQTFHGTLEDSGCHLVICSTRRALAFSSLSGSPANILAARASRRSAQPDCERAEARGERLCLA